MKISDRILFLICFAPIFPLLAQVGPEQQALNDFLAHPAVRSATVSACFLDEKGRSVAEFRAENRAIPASSLKPVTSGFLWLEKGSGYQWATTVGYRGYLDGEGILAGDLIIRPTGDPSLGSVYADNELGRLLESITDSLKSKNIFSIKGGIFVDVSAFSDNPVPGSWSREDAGNYYGGGYFALNVLDNAYTLCFEKREQEGQQPVISRCVPRVDIRWQLQLLTGPAGSGDQAYIFGGPETRKKSIYGTIPAGEGEFCIKGAMPDPPRFFLDTLARHLSRAGISSNFFGAMPLADSDKMIELYTHRSPTLLQLLPVTLQKSLNLYTDAFLFAMAGTEANTWERAADKLAERIAMAAGEGEAPVLHDGSGMSPANGISSRQLAAALQYFHEKMPDHQVYLTCFPKDGERTIWLKSGSMSGVQAYAGYIKKRNGSTIAFSVMVNQISEDESRSIREGLLRMIRAIAAVE